MIEFEGIDSDYELTLNKMNMSILGNIDISYLKSIEKSISDINKISLSVPKYIYDSNFKRVINPIYNNIKHERLICVNEKEIYVIKNIENSNGYKNLKCESREVVLKKMDLKFEDIGFRLMSSDESNNIYSLNDYMFEETGWKFGHIDDSVKFQSDGITEKMRWQESIDSYWYNYLTKNIAEQFECIVIFDSYNKLVNLYGINEFGGGVKLYLSNDNYVKSLEKQTSSSDIITRLKIEGNEGLSIKEYTPGGVDYLENYSYFIQNKEMSEELIEDLNTYYIMVEKRTVTWKELLSLKSEKNKMLNDKKMEMLQLIADIKAKEGIKRVYESKNDIENMTKVMTEITKLRDKEIILDKEILSLEDEIDNITSSINNINILCQKPTATDDNGELIFTESTLNELKGFTYTDTFDDDSFIQIEDIISVGKRMLEIKSKPTSTWDIDVIDFTSKIIDNKFNQHFKGVLGLGDVIILYNEDEDIEEWVYLTKYSKDIKDGSLNLTLSNKKVDRGDLLNISDILTESKKTSKLLKSKRYLLIQQEKNRINLNYNKGGIGYVKR